MANEVAITNTPLAITTQAGIRIPVVVENRPNEAVPVQVVNSPEIHGTVRLEPLPVLHVAPPDFLVVGRDYDLHPLMAVGDFPQNPVRVQAIAFPWVQVRQVPPAGVAPPPPPAIWINTGLILGIVPR